MQRNGFGIALFLAALAASPCCAKDFSVIVSKPRTSGPAPSTEPEITARPIPGLADGVRLAANDSQDRTIFTISNVADEILYFPWLEMNAIDDQNREDPRFTSVVFLASATKERSVLYFNFKAISNEDCLGDAAINNAVRRSSGVTSANRFGQYQLWHQLYNCRIDQDWVDPIQMTRVEFGLVQSYTRLNSLIPLLPTEAVNQSAESLSEKLNQIDKNSENNPLKILSNREDFVNDTKDLLRLFSQKEFDLLEIILKTARDNNKISRTVKSCEYFNLVELVFHSVENDVQEKSAQNALVTRVANAIAEQMTCYYGRQSNPTDLNEIVQRARKSLEQLAAYAPEATDALVRASAGVDQVEEKMLLLRQ